METLAHLDTHVVAWLYAGALKRFPAGVRRILDDAEALVCSPMVVLELQYLFEVGKVTTPSREVMADLNARIGLCVAVSSLGDAVVNSVSFSWTRDPFDRIIAAQSHTEGAVLLTADGNILGNLALAYWE